MKGKPTVSCALINFTQMQKMIDYRSDTVTRPGTEMLEAMRQAKVGDDVYGEDPSINELESKAAAMFGMEAALFCPSGTMTNQIAIKCHTRPGDEVVCDESSHIYQYEVGGIAVNSHCSVKLLYGDRGRVTAEMVSQAINPIDIHRTRTRLVSLENTANRGGGSCYQLNDIEDIRELCDEKGLALHLDGARLFNALIATNQHALQYGSLFHSISICLSKSLGCPVGSLLLGSKDFIREARRIRKLFGGGMRQAGYLAAAGIYALDHNIQRLAIDHEHAKKLAEAWSSHAMVTSVMPVETNILIFNVDTRTTAKALVEQLKTRNILAYAINPQQIRMVTHLDVSPEMIDQTIETIKTL